MKEVLQFDDFASNAKEVRDSVIAKGFTSEIGPDGALYTGISKRQMPEWFDRIAEVIGKPIVPKLSCFRLNFEGELPHSWVHSDDICAKYASVLYLNLPEQCKGGTGFWRHVDLGIDRLPTREELKAIQINPDEFYERMTIDWKILRLWKQHFSVSMKWNRFITYPTCLFHSRYPHEGFGKGPEDGRLIWICFYDIASEVTS